MAPSAAIASSDSRVPTEFRACCRTGPAAENFVASPSKQRMLVGRVGRPDERRVSMKKGDVDALAKKRASSTLARRASFERSTKRGTKQIEAQHGVQEKTTPSEVSPIDRRPWRRSTTPEAPPPTTDPGASTATMAAPSVASGQSSMVSRLRERSVDTTKYNERLTRARRFGRVERMIPMEDTSDEADDADDADDEYKASSRKRRRFRFHWMRRFRFGRAAATEA